MGVTNLYGGDEFVSVSLQVLSLLLLHVLVYSLVYIVILLTQSPDPPQDPLSVNEKPHFTHACAGIVASKPRVSPSIIGKPAFLYRFFESQ